MANEVQLYNSAVTVGLQSNIAPMPQGLYLQDTSDHPVNHSVVFGGLPQNPLLSTVKIMRPDGTWATTVQVVGVHLRLPDGTWQVFL